MTSKGVNSWREAIAVYWHPRVVAVFFLGFSAGLPFLLVFSTLTAWLTDMQVSRSTIGFFSWVGITYSVKVFWSPIVDRIALPILGGFLGQRRSWMLLAQMMIAIGFLLMADTDPAQHLWQLAVIAVIVAFASSTQDIAIDAYRIEATIPEYQGVVASSYIFGYRVALLVAGAGALFIADDWSWPIAYRVMSGLMLVGMITVWIIDEPEKIDRHIVTRTGPYWVRAADWFRQAVIVPFADFFQRNKGFAITILCFVAVYRLSDIIMGIMANPFYLDLGFTKTDIALIGKVYGFSMSLVGAFLGGLLVVRYGIFRPLITGAIMVALTNVLFAQLSLVGPDLTWLSLVISADNISGGFANSVFIAYLSSLINRTYTATQYALFSSLMTLPGKFVGGFSGVVVDGSGYYHFFMYAALLGIPAILLSIYAYRVDSRATS